MTPSPADVAAGAADPRPGLRLVVIATLLTAVLTAAGVLLAWRNERAERDRVEEQALVFARAAAADVDKFLGDRLDLLQTVASSPSVRIPDPLKMQEFFTDVRATDPTFDSFGWVDSDGLLRLQVPEGSGDPVKVDGTEYFRTVAETGRPYVGDGVMSAQDNRAGVVLAVPMRDPAGAWIGVLAVGVDLSRIATTFASFNSDITGDVMVVDRSGQMIAGGDGITNVADSSLLARARAQGSGVVPDARGLAGQDHRLVSFATAPVGDWLVFVDRPAEEAFAPARRTFFLSLAALLGLAFVGVGAAGWAGQRLDRSAAAERRALNDLTTEVRERQQMADELRLRGERLRLVTDAMPVLISYVDTGGYFRFNNRAYADWFGIDPQTVPGRHLREVLGEPAHALLQPYVERVLAGEHVDFEQTLPYDGTTRAIGAVFVPHLEGGRVLGFYGLITDVTARKRAEEERDRLLTAEQAARREAEAAAERTARLQAVTAALATALRPAQVAQVIVEQGMAALDATAGSVVMLTEDGADLEIVQAAGHPPELMEAWRRFPLDQPTPVGDAVRSGLPVLLTSVAARDAAYPDLAAAFVPADSGFAAIPLIVDEHAIGAVGLTFGAPRTFSEDDAAFMLAVAGQGAQALERARLYEAEQEARAAAETARQRLAFLAEASSVLAGSLDFDATLQNVARLLVPAMADWCTVDRQTPAGEIERLAAAAADPEKEALLREMVERYPLHRRAGHPITTALRTGRVELQPDVPASWVGEIAFDDEHRRMLERIDIRSRLTVPLVARGQRLGALSLGYSESGRRYTASDLALAQELAQRAAIALENARLYQEVQDALRVRDEFLASVSHDLRSPITSIKGFAQVLIRRARRAATPESPALVEGLERIDAAATRMTGLIDQLLDVVRLQIGQPLDLERAPVDLVALARHSVEEHHQTSPRHDVRLETDLPRLMGVVDAARLERVLSNLLSNAIKYSPDGGPVLVTVGRDQQNGSAVPRARLVVQDHGLGIPADDLPHIFDRFRRGGNVVGKIAGSGIGLAGVRQIVEQHGGTITAQSTEGQGTTVVVSVPLDEE